MTNNVVKTDALVDFLIDISALISSDDTKALCRNSLKDFIRTRSFPVSMLLQYFIFRNHTNTQSELTDFFFKINQIDRRISKQAFYKAAHKLNPTALSILIHRFAKTFYQSDLVKKFHDYIVLAEDGTFLEMPLTDKNIADFGFVLNQHVKDIDDVKSVQSKAGGLYDITNGLMVDFTIHRAERSEIPIAFEHLYRNTDTFGNHKVMYLADRYYGSAELISYLESSNIKYCLRGKSNFYKKQVAAMTSDDEWIDVLVDSKWVKRFRFSPEAVKIRKSNPHMRIRCVKSSYEYTDDNGEKLKAELIFFTNLSQEEFSSEDIVALYGRR